MLVFIAVLVYLIPSAIAFTREVPHRGSVLVINLFLGWTFVGWVVALAMAVRSMEREANDPRFQRYEEGNDSQPAI